MRVSLASTLEFRLPSPHLPSVPVYVLPDGMLSEDIERACWMAVCGARYRLLRWGHHLDGQRAADYDQSAVDALSDMVTALPPASWDDLTDLAQMAAGEAYADYLKQVYNRSPSSEGLTEDLAADDDADTDDGGEHYHDRLGWSSLAAGRPDLLPLVAGIRDRQSIAEMAAHQLRSERSIQRDLADLRRYMVSRLSRQNLYQLAVSAAQSTL